jgi:tRNA-specific 2-thiouridylase
MKPGTGKKVLVAMSGGVDSSVTAALLKDDGYEVVGCFMRNGDEENEAAGVGCRVPGVGPSQQNTSHPENACVNPNPETRNPKPAPSHRQGCCSVNDAADARLVAAILDIPFYVLNFRKDFARIKDYFTAEYNAGRTPNPCVRCNDWLKFGKLFDYSRSIDADFIATGHYARVVNEESSGFRAPSSELDTDYLDARIGMGNPEPGGPARPRLLRGIDHHKDQSYVLFGMKPDRLARMLLPIGHLHKPAVRQIAHDLGLPVFNKPDSYEICFVPDNDYRGFLHRRDPAAFTPGTILDAAGQTIGEHEGHQNFTIGQRRGLPVNRSFPLYVIAKDAAANTITLGPREASNARGLRADQCNWLIDPPRQPRRCTAKIRSNAEPVHATVTTTGNETLEVSFDEPQHAVTPGQAVVCYDGEELIGGGWIVEAV